MQKNAQETSWWDGSLSPAKHLVMYKLSDSKCNCQFRGQFNKAANIALTLTYN